MSAITDDDYDDVRELIERLAEAGLLVNEEWRIRRFMLKACEAIEGPADATYSSLVELARRCQAGECTAEAIRDGRAKASTEMDRSKDTNLLNEASFRSIRFLLIQPDSKILDAFDVLWAFVESTERAGLQDAQLAELLRQTFPELQGTRPRTSSESEEPENDH